MPWLSMYLVDRDVKTLCALLDEDPDAALIVPAGKHRWKARRGVPATLKDGEYALWHIPSGDIDLEDNKPKSNPVVVRDPFRGWKARVPEVEHGCPWFGSGRLGIVFLTIRRRWSQDESVIGRSDFYWVGNYYSIVSRKYKAPQSTMAWWKSLRRRIAKVAVQIPAIGSLKSKPKDVWAFAGALEEIRRGRKRAANP